MTCEMRTRKRTKITEITLERTEVLLVQRAKTRLFAHCEGCGARVQMVTPDEAATAAGVTTRTIYRRIETGKVHFTETSEGLLLVCFSSLSAKETRI